MRIFDYIIVGAGLYGSVIAEQLKNRNKRVLIIEKRNHIGGNCYSYDHPGTNITVHKYGTHIFHTNNEKIWSYINNFGTLNRYQHRVLTVHKNRVYSMPINLGTINSFYDLNLKPSEVQKFIEKRKKHIKNPKNLEQKAVNLIGKELYEAFIRGYTAKQWAHDPKELSPDIIERLPVRNSYYDSYYDDYFQGLPIDGYTGLFEHMLEGVTIKLKTDFFDNPDFWIKHCKKLIYTGPIDHYFNYRYGHLKWRSVRFEEKKYKVEDFQGTSVMNYADKNVPFTRIHEPKHLHREKKHYPVKTTVVIKEFSCNNEADPYYPVNSGPDRLMLSKYSALAKKEKKVIFGGRLAEYKYYDMDDVIEKALIKAKNL